MNKKDLKKFGNIISMHELADRLNHNKNGGNFNAADLCHLDNTVIKQLISEGYSLGDIHKHVTKVFKGGQKRYKILKKYIEDFEKKTK